MLLAHHPGALGPINHLGFSQIISVVGAALLDSINPTALGVLLLILWQGLSRGKSTKKAAYYYMAGIITAYLAAGILLRRVYLDFGPSLAVQGLQTLLALLLFYAGFSELVNAIKPHHKKLLEIPEVVKKGASKFTDLMGKGFAYPVGIGFGFLELFSTGAIYLTFIQAITYDPSAPWWVLLTMMIIYLAAFALPMIAVLVYEPLVEALMTKNVSRISRIAKGTVGILFMVAAAFIAASAYVTVQSSENFWWL